MIDVFLHCFPKIRSKLVIVSLIRKYGTLTLFTTPNPFHYPYYLLFALITCMVGQFHMKFEVLVIQSWMHREMDTPF